MSTTSTVTIRSHSYSNNKAVEPYKQPSPRLATSRGRSPVIKNTGAAQQSTIRQPPTLAVGRLQSDYFLSEEAGCELHSGNRFSLAIHPQTNHANLYAPSRPMFQRA